MIGYGSFELMSVLVQLRSSESRVQEGALKFLHSELLDPIKARIAVNNGILDWLCATLTHKTARTEDVLQLTFSLLERFTSVAVAQEKLVDSVILKRLIATFSDPLQSMQLRRSLASTLARLCSHKMGLEQCMSCCILESLFVVIKEPNYEIKCMGYSLLRNLIQACEAISASNFFLTQLLPLLVSDLRVGSSGVIEVLTESCRDEKVRSYCVAANILDSLTSIIRNESFWDLMSVLSVDVRFKKDSFAMGFLDKAVLDHPSSSQYMLNMSEYPSARDQIRELLSPQLRDDIRLSRFGSVLIEKIS